MRRLGLILLGVVIGIAQLSLRGFGAGVVIPNLALVSIVYLSGRWGLSEIGSVALAAAVVLELSSAAPLGTQIFGLVLIILVAKVLLRSSDEDHQPGFLYALLLSSTIGYNVVLALSLPFGDLQPHWWTLAGLIALECLYNSIIFGLFWIVGLRRAGMPKQYRLPS